MKADVAACHISMLHLLLVHRLAAAALGYQVMLADLLLAWHDMRVSHTNVHIYDCHLQYMQRICAFAAAAMEPITAAYNGVTCSVACNAALQRFSC